MARNVLRAALLTIGDEVLRGDTVDTNKAFLGTELTARGIQVCLAVTIPDDVNTISDWVRRLSADYDYVFCCGGIGPTPDDKTRPAIAAAFGLGLAVYKEELARFEREHGITLNAGQREMWNLPAGCELLWGEGVRMPGCRVENVYVFPGVPAVMQAMWHWVADRFQGVPRHVVKFESRARESLFSAVMADYIARYPELEFGSYPRLKNGWSVMIAIRGVDAGLVERVAVEFKQAIEATSASG